jgi:hypothetical protein
MIRDTVHLNNILYVIAQSPVSGLWALLAQDGHTYKNLRFQTQSGAVAYGKNESLAHSMRKPAPLSSVQKRAQAIGLRLVK